MFDSLSSLSDHQVLANIDTIMVQDRRLTLTLLVHLNEIERRKLHLSLGYSSMFDYCRSRLRLSEPAAVRRIRTARCLARFPQLYPLLESGEVNLMSVSMIAKLLTPENAAPLIARIRGKSKKEVEAIVAEYEPRFLVPPDRVRTVVVPVSVAAPAPARKVTVTGDGKKSSNADTIEPDSSNSTMTFESRSVIQFTAREMFMAKVARARALLSHQIPGATFEQLFELALDELIARRDPVARQKRREQRPAAAKRSATENGPRNVSAVNTSSVESGERYVSAAVRDDVFVRDGFRCTFVGPDGRRCTSNVCLQVDHIRPVARGGASTRENLRILCAAHNRLEAERLMGSVVARGRPAPH